MTNRIPNTVCLIFCLSILDATSQTQRPTLQELLQDRELLLGEVSRTFNDRGGGDIQENTFDLRLLSEPLQRPRHLHLHRPPDPSLAARVVGLVYNSSSAVIPGAELRLYQNISKAAKGPLGRPVQIGPLRLSGDSQPQHRGALLRFENRCDSRSP